VLNTELDERAREMGKSRRTLRNWHTAYQRHGFLGLAPKGERSDKGQRHGSEWITEITEGVRLSNPDWSVRAVHEEVCKRARRRGEPEPGLWKVRSICENISQATRHLADGREDDFRNGYRISGKMKHRGVTYQIDHTRVDVLVRDIRKGHARSKSGVIRPWLTLCLESRSRLVVAAMFGYDQPNRHTVAAVLRDALLTSDEKPRGGIPRQVRVDRGKDLIAEHVFKLARGIDFELYPTYLPEHKGNVERFFGTLNERLWNRQPGYVASSVAERNPKAEERATLTISELVEKFWQFIDAYHREEHSDTGMTPIDCWDTCCFTDDVDPRQLDTLLYEEKEPRVVNKDGVHYGNRVYWHSSFATIIREKITLRAEPTYAPPDTIEIYYKREWFCTACATDSDIAERTITAATTREAQKEQRAFHRARIAQARAVVDADDKEAAQEASTAASSETLQTSPERSRPTPVSSPSEEQPSKTVPTGKRSRPGQATLALFAEPPDEVSGDENA
jgi:hypothetical protein